MAFDARGVFPDIDPAQAAEVRVLVLTGYGLNCEAETKAGFTMLGAQSETMHVGDLLEQSGAALDGSHVLAFIGGFSFGDHVSGGCVYANRLRTRLGDAIAKFVDAGGLAIGMCNGFQTMVKLGLLPALGRKQGSGLASQGVSLVSNDRLGYWDTWVRMQADADSPCAFTKRLEFFDLPSRHGEGKLVFKDDAQRAELEQKHLIPVRYVDASGQATEHWPENPNGSPGGAAGLCDESGRLFGLMPHPEAYLYPENHPRWISQRDSGELPAVGLGLHLLANGVRAAIADT
jgi:phosphoribosylformylglycinamidine synthase